MKGILIEKLNWPLPRPLNISRHHCGQDLVGPTANMGGENFKDKLFKFKFLCEGEGWGMARGLTGYDRETEKGPPI